MALLRQLELQLAYIVILGGPAKPGQSSPSCCVACSSPPGEADISRGGSQQNGVVGEELFHGAAEGMQPNLGRTGGW